jgi:hypothetical protein
MKILNFWDKIYSNKRASKEVPKIPSERAWNLDLKSQFTFCIWSCELGVMAKRMVISQIKGNM